MPWIRRRFVIVITACAPDILCDATVVLEASVSVSQSVRLFVKKVKNCQSEIDVSR